MEQEQILSEIRARVGQTNLSDKTLGVYISKHIPADGVEPDDAYWNEHVEFIKSLNGNYSHDVSSEVNKFKKDYKPEPAKKEPQNQHESEDGNSELLKRLEALEQERINERKTAQSNSIKSELKSKGDGLKVSNKAIWNDVVDSIEVKDGSDVESLVTEAKKVYERKLKEYTGDGAVPYGGSQKSSTTQVSSEDAKARREAFKLKMQSQGRLPKEESKN